MFQLISISFRKVSPLNEDTEISFNVPDTSIGDTPKASQIPKVSIIAGDSLVKDLDPIRLGRKGRKTVINVSKGGASIKDVSHQLDDYYGNVNNEGSVVEKVFICVGKVISVNVGGRV